MDGILAGGRYVSTSRDVALSVRQVCWAPTEANWVRVVDLYPDSFGIVRWRFPGGSKQSNKLGEVGRLIFSLLSAQQYRKCT
jgi:hypothetical protein